MKLNYRLLQSWLLIMGFGLSLLYANNQILTGDQTQMLYKGYLGAYQQTWLPFGNAASAVGNVPGYLSALAVGGPLMLWDNPWAPMLFVLLLRLCSFFLFDAIIKQVFKPQTRLLFTVLYWLNPWLLYDSLIYNPSYLCFFTAVHFWSAFKQKDKPSFIYSMLHVLAIGGAMQFHYSWPVLAVVSCCLLYRNMAKPAWLGVFAGLSIIAISLIPYALESMTNQQISRESDRYIGYGLVHVYPVIKAFIYWLRYGSMLFSNRIITEANFDWISQIDWIRSVIRYSWQALLFIAGAVTVVLNAKINWQTWKEIKPKLAPNSMIDNDKDWLLLFAVATVIGILICAMLSPITFSYWHLILAFPIALFPILVFAEKQYTPTSKKFIQGVVALSIAFVVINLVAANDSDKYSYQVNFAKQVQQYLVEQNFIQ